jgi:hypothetical protein
MLSMDVALLVYQDQSILVEETRSYYRRGGVHRLAIG